MGLLDDLALAHGTDKASTEHDYCPHYEQYLGPIRHRPITLFELGVFKGASLRMWRDYLPDATIIGLDINPVDFTIPGVTIYQGSQDDPARLKQINADFGPFDIVIDDASHLSSKTIASFENLYPYLKPGGLYVIEDLQTSYDRANYGRSEADPDPGGDTPTAMAFCKRLADEVNNGLYPVAHQLGYDLHSVAFFINICFITKGGS